MANIKSQKKRILITKEENARNTALRTRCKNAVKKYEAAIAEGDVAKAKELLPDTVSIITKAGIYKDNTVSRKVARFSKMLYELEKASAPAAEAAPGVLGSICRGELRAVPQDSVSATVCTKIRKADGLIRWTGFCQEIEAMVRAYCPWPGAFSRVRTSKGEESVTLLRVAMRRDLAGRPGEVLRADKYGLVVACGRGAIEILELAPPGRRSMPATAWLNGLRGEIPEFLPQ